ncbi:hypothetical protein XENTR_v10010983 [Xenopus tropicalis]|uniref:PRKC apoptosis WT1 regulator protein n=1 Tax=Xenopus tropicalis TaxID=8364 RepID=A0A8J0R2N4_XENTR|nr:PRKC apoptosis WT1 regulator protein [Xenopus tropicalis]XP_031756417.1 PRKC apoptosis WT1 regulator protein [Xenopus tropicalis]KAE8607055.1 hypothetical protein XENTR_v10010983 [Xenopus tropicalis]KAE8607056.1 hypothetical protein XENTR_v10010983 [Xenopus tropicalis]|eukprot:XP_004913478.1 PREDICTED: PRKC apoptosis WT1 regulator protein-like [Xenopus tropicalis]
MSRDGKYSSSEQAPFMEEWKARRERMRLRSSSSSLVGSVSIDASYPHHVREQQAEPQNLHVTKEKGTEAEGRRPVENTARTYVTVENSIHDSTVSKNKEKKGSGEKKHRTQIEKRKLREKRRPTGVAYLTQLEDADESPDHVGVQDGQKAEVPNQELKKSQGVNQNRAHSCPESPYQDGRQKTGQALAEELQKEVAGKQQDNHNLTVQLKDKEATLTLLQMEMKTVTRKMKKAEDENKRLKEENQMLLKVMTKLS